MSKEKKIIDSIKKDAEAFKADKKYKDRYEEYENMKQTLSDNLYSKNSHFIYELIQNAEDNIYDDSVTPTLKFIVSNQGILTQNNEIGFNESNIKSICKFSTSSKKGQKELGYIGENSLAP
jgi:sacsin